MKNDQINFLYIGLFLSILLISITILMRWIFISHHFILEADQVLIAGLILTALIFTIFYLMHHSHRRYQAKLVLSQTHLDRNTQLLHYITEIVNGGFISIDKKNKILDWNNYAEKMFGWSKQEAVGKYMHHLIIPAKYHKQHLDELKKFIKNDFPVFFNQAIELFALNKDGTEFPIELVIFSTRTDDHSTFHALVRDCTESKKIKKLKDDLFTIVNYKLPHSLIAIHGALSLLLDEKFSEKIQKLLEKANLHTEKLLHLTNSLLDIQNIEENKIKFKFKTIDLNKLIQDCIYACHLWIEKYQVKILFLSTEESNIWGDYDKLRQVIMNMLFNAIQASPSGESIIIKVIHSEQYTRISIKDHGEGITDELRPNIFEKFSNKAHATSEDIRVGLGLFLSKLIIEKHEGNIGFESKLHEGSTFYCDLPLKQKKSSNENVNE